MGDCMNRLKKIIQDIWYKKINTFLAMILLPFFKNKELKNIIVMESHTNFDCNGGALYNYLIKQGYNKKYTIVWRIRTRHLNKKLPQNVRVVRDDCPSIRKVYYMLNAKYFFSDDEMLKKIRGNQVSVYCTHGGCTLKNVKGLLNVREDVDYILSASENYDPIMCQNYSIEYPNNRMLHFGFPSNDILFCDEIKETHKVSLVEYKKTILWLPTFRNLIGGRDDSKEDYPYGVPLFKNYDSLKEINDFLNNKHVHLIIKLHPYQRVGFDAKEINLSNISFITREIAEEKDIDVYRLMASVDALISDYSSAAYSFILLNRPLAFVLSDIDNYDRKFDLSDSKVKRFLPGNMLLNTDDFRKFIEDVLSGIDRKADERNELVDWLYKYKDGKACERIVEFFNL